MSKCCIPGCERELRPLSKLESCQVCRNAMGTAIRKGAHWFKKRTVRLKMYLARTENVAHGRKVW